MRNKQAIIFLLCILVSVEAFARPYLDRLGICYEFEGDKEKRKAPCVISGGYGAGGFYTTLLNNLYKKPLQIDDNNAPDSSGITLDGVQAQSYMREGIFYRRLTDREIDEQTLDDKKNNMLCVQAKEQEISYCYRSFDSN